jgi:HrpA-like RNA helicase
MESVLTTVLDAARHRPSLRVVVMSATIDTAKYQGFLSTPGPIRVAGTAGASAGGGATAGAGAGARAGAGAGAGTRSISCDSLDIPGVNFPVTEVFAGSTWDINATGAITNLAHEVLRVYNSEPGNLLIFLMNVQQVRDAVAVTTGLLSHDRLVDVLPLYASLPESERARVEQYVPFQETELTTGRISYLSLVEAHP